MQSIQIKEYEHRDLIGYGRLVTFDITMEPYPDKRQRTIRVLLPEGGDGTKEYPVLYMHDAQMLFPGLDSRPTWRVDLEMKKLHEQGLDAVIVGIDTSMHRGSELCPDMLPTSDHFMLGNETPSGDLYARFLVEELMPVVEANFPVKRSPQATGVGGASMGGMISHYIAMKYPECFSKCMVFSPAYSFVDWEAVKQQMAKRDWERARGNRCYILSGGNDVERRLFTLCSSVRCYEHMMEMGVDEEHVLLVTDSRLLHHENSWRAMFGDAFRYLYA